jgi:acyl-CoA synthetase (AMP-forming)/AMP-acid ligase II
MIKTSGANVSPREVEAAILAVSGRAAHVLGVDDDARGQVVAAAVVTGDDETLSAQQLDVLRVALAERLSAYKVPRILMAVPVGQVPMMSSGKLDARALRRLLADG